MIENLPRYRCHKIVGAAKILAITHTSAGALLSCALPPPDLIVVDHDYVRKHHPQPGGYFVEYEDGYHSFSPAKAFEEGYAAHAGADQVSRREIIDRLDNLADLINVIERKLDLTAQLVTPLTTPLERKRNTLPWP